MTSPLLSSDQGGCDVSCLEDWIFRAPQVSLYLEMLVAEGLHLSLSGRLASPLLPPCQETSWKELSCLLDLLTLMFLAPQVRMQVQYTRCWQYVEVALCSLCQTT